MPTHPEALAFLSAALESLRNWASLVQAPAFKSTVAQQDHLAEYPPARNAVAANPD